MTTSRGGRTSFPNLRAAEATRTTGSRPSESSAASPRARERSSAAAASTAARAADPRLDGVWRVERIGGLLPPLIGVTKRIQGGKGETRIGPLPGAPFDVEGLVLHYRPPFIGFVDELQPAADGFVGRAKLFGREVGTFRMRPVKAR